MHELYCIASGCKTKPDWLVNYGTDYVALLCNDCISPYSYTKLITSNEFVNDQYLAELICKDMYYVYYSSGFSNKMTRIS